MKYISLAQALCLSLGLSLFLLTATLPLSPDGQLAAQQSDRTDRYLETGEYSLALQHADQAESVAVRDRRLADIAQHQSIHGARMGSFETAVAIGDDQMRRNVLAQISNSSLTDSSPPPGLNQRMETTASAEALQTLEPGVVLRPVISTTSWI